jgi:CheY-like chemotaxis protein
MISTHWRQPHDPAASELRMLDVLARMAADLIERTLTEERLREADRRKDEFLATLAHELRNPLAAISNSIRLSRTPELSERDQLWIQEMLDRQMELLGRLVDDLLDIARITQRQIELKRDVSPLGDIIGRVVEAVRPQFDRARHCLSVERSPEPMYVLADRARLEQVLVNLLSNAAKYTPDGGQIWLQLARDGNEAVVTVRDNGIGIASGMLPRVFDMFAQAEQGRDRAQGGLGIGLTLVRRLVEMHGGHIAVFSAGPGKGSTFTVRLPLAQPAAAGHLAPAPAPTNAAAQKNSNGQPLRILIVDDNRDAAQTLARLLKLTGHQTQVAFDGPSALTLAADQPPQLALLDIGLPIIDGYELAGRLKAAHPGIVLAAISGYGQAADRQRAKEAGFDEHFTKPVKLESLLELIESRHSAAAS